MSRINSVKELLWDDAKDILECTIPLIWKHRTKIQNDKCMFLTLLPYAWHFQGNIRLGTLLRCWQEDKDFQLIPCNAKAATLPMFVFTWGGSPMSGACFCHAISPLTGEIIRCSNGFSFKDSWNYKCSGVGTYEGGYRKKDTTKVLLEEGVEPFSFQALLNQLQIWESMDEETDNIDIPNKAADYELFLKKEKDRQKSLNDKRIGAVLAREAEINDFIAQHRDEVSGIIFAYLREEADDKQKSDVLKNQRVALRKKLKSGKLTQEKYRELVTPISNEIFCLMANAWLHLERAVNAICKNYNFESNAREILSVFKDIGK
jgi:hypothetical protein